MALSFPHRLVLAGVGADAHSVGLTLLRRSLSRIGYEIDFLGTQNTLERLCRSARSADAVLVSVMDGHAHYYLEGLAAMQESYAVSDRLWYLGGNPTLADGKPESELYALGFDRIYTRFVELKAVHADLGADLQRRPSRELAAREVDKEEEAPTTVAFAGVLAERDEVLHGWHTGAAASSLGDNGRRLDE